MAAMTFTDDQWQQAYNNAAERLFPGLIVLDQDADYICIAEANEAERNGNTTDETYRAFAQGLADGDPEILDRLPSAPLNGEWADDPTPTSLLHDLGVEDDGPGRWDFLLDAFEVGFESGVSDEVVFTLRYQLRDECPEL